MPEFWPVVAFLLTALLSILGTLAIREGHDLMPYFAARIVKAVAQRMPGEAEDRQMYADMWIADLEAVPGKMVKLAWALGLMRAPWDAWQNEYGCSPLVVRLELWNRVRICNHFLQVFPASPPLTAAGRGRQIIGRGGRKFGAGPVDTSQMLKTLEEMDRKELWAGMASIILATPGLIVDEMLEWLLERPGVGVPAEHRDKMILLLPQSLKDRLLDSYAAHEHDGLYLSEYGK